MRIYFLPEWNQQHFDRLTSNGYLAVEAVEHVDQITPCCHSSSLLGSDDYVR